MALATAYDMVHLLLSTRLFWRFVQATSILVPLDYSVPSACIPLVHGSLWSHLRALQSAALDISFTAIAA